MKVSPSVLSADFSHLYDSCAQVVDAGADMIHFDVMDGCFVDNISFGLPVLESLPAALPNTVYDVHLMIAYPCRFVKRFVEAGADMITFHIETEDDILKTIQEIQNCGAKVGLAIHPDTPVQKCFPYLEYLDLVLVMGVIPGHGGQAFLPKTLNKLRLLRAECARREISLDISVDGGVKLQQTGPDCAAAGANVLVAGSAVFQAEDIPGAIKAFKTLGAF